MVDDNTSSRMLYSDDIDAWYSDSLDKLRCPMCGSDVGLSWNDCSCGATLNVEKIHGDDSDVFVMTVEHDEMASFSAEATSQLQDMTV